MRVAQAMVLGDAQAAGTKPPMGLWHPLGVHNYATHYIKFRVTPRQDTFGTTHG